MFQVIATWNLSRPDEEMRDSVEGIELRGYDPETFLTGNFAVKLRDQEIKPLSVGNIADKYCPTRRDLYFYKGINRLRGYRQKNWGQKVGYFVESYIETILNEKQVNSNLTYSRLKAQGQGMHKRFKVSKNTRKSIKELRKLEISSQGVKEGDSEWLLTLLNNNGRAELGLRHLHSLLKESNSLNVNEMKIREGINPDLKQIGINAPVEPDFIAPHLGIVGDIKTGTKFEAWYQLTCTGYALAYENGPGSKDKININWGIIYFFPTRNPSAYVRPVTFAQVYIFPIDDKLRNWFLADRNQAYNIISKKKPPILPREKSEKYHCPYCRFKNYCLDEGLRLDDA